MKEEKRKSEEKKRYEVIITDHAILNFSPLSVTSESFIYYEIRDNSLASCLLTILERT